MNLFFRLRLNARLARVAGVLLLCLLPMEFPEVAHGQARVALADACVDYWRGLNRNVVAELLSGDVEVTHMITDPSSKFIKLIGYEEFNFGNSTRISSFEVICSQEAAWAVVEYHTLWTEWDGKPTAQSIFSPAGGNAPSRQAGTPGPGVVVGYTDRGGFTPYHAFRWNEAEGVVDLGTLDPPNNSARSSGATGVSHDGSIVVGSSDTAIDDIQHAFRWTAATGMVDLGAPAGPTRNSRALDVSGDGAVIVGEAEFIDPAQQLTGIRSGAFRWTAAGGFQSLGAVEPGYFTRSNATSVDGSVIVGEGGIEIRVGNNSTNGSRAFRWTQGGGLVVLGPLPGQRFGAATDVSDDGAVVVGTYSSDVASGAFRWTATTGTQDLRQLLVSSGLDLGERLLISATSVSGDGQWILGEMRLAGANLYETKPFLARICDAAVSLPCEDIPPPSPNFSVSVPGGTELTTPAGSSASTTLRVTPQNGFTQGVTFACSDLPPGAECSFSPTTVTPATGPVTTTLTLTTTGLARVPAPLGERAPGLPLGALLALGILSMSVLLASQASSWRRAVPRLCAAVAVATVGGCGDSGPAGPSPTPAGTYEVTVTATGGSGASALEKTTALTLTVTS